MRRTMRSAWIIVSLILAACGGGGGGSSECVALPSSIEKCLPDPRDFKFPPPLGYSIEGTVGKRWKGLEAIPRAGTVPDGGVLLSPEKGKTLRVTIQKDEPGAWTLTLCVEEICRTTTTEFGIVTVEVTG